MACHMWLHPIMCCKESPATSLQNTHGLYDSLGTARELYALTVIDGATCAADMVRTAFKNPSIWVVYCFSGDYGLSHNPRYSAHPVILKSAQSDMQDIEKSFIMLIMCKVRGWESGTRKHFLCQIFRQAADCADTKMAWTATSVRQDLRTMPMSSANNRICPGACEIISRWKSTQKGSIARTKIKAASGHPCRTPLRSSHINST